MKIIEPKVIIKMLPDARTICERIEAAGRTCYKSEDKIGPGTAEKMITSLIKKGHESVLEHITIGVKLVCDRGISHEIVRHRLCSFSQESTRYANYSKDKFGKEITVIRPFFWEVGTAAYNSWRIAMGDCEFAYLKLIEGGAKAQEARSVLPNSLKTEIDVTANIRQWREMFAQRCHRTAHPQMRQLMVPLLRYLYAHVPLLFEDLNERFKGYSGPCARVSKYWPKEGVLEHYT